MIRGAALILALAACGAPPAAQQAQASAAAAPIFGPEHAAQWRLPERLREISGLAVAPDGRVFAHDDETAIIYEIDAARGALVKSFALGDPVERGDFEGLAITAGGAFWLTTAQGVLFRFREGANGAHVAFDRFDTGLRDTCELEGLGADDGGLILACKQNQARSMRDTVSLYRWTEAGGAQPFATLPEREIADAAGVERFRPSSLDYDTARGGFLLLSARDGALATLSAAGDLLAAQALGSAHVQAEGVAVLNDGALIIADEGGDGRALLTRYKMTP